MCMLHRRDETVRNTHDTVELQGLGRTGTKIKRNSALEPSIRN